MNAEMRTWVSLLFLLLVVILLAGVAFYNQTTPSPSVETAGVSISQFQVLSVEAVNISGSTLVIQFTIKNSTPVGATIENATYNLYADGNYIGRGLVNQPVKVPARGSVAARTDFLLPLKGSLLWSWTYFIDGGAVSWRAVGNATLAQSFLGAFNLQFNCLSSPGYSSISCAYTLR